LALLVVVAAATGAWATERVLIDMNGPREPGVPIYSLQELPPFGGDGGSMNVDPVLEQIHDYGVRHRDVYAGAFISGRYVVVGFTQDVEQNLRILQSVVGQTVQLRGVMAEFSFEKLKQTVENISKDMRMWQSRGIDISSVSIDEYQNRVAVTLSEASEAAMSALQDAYGREMLTFSEGTFSPA